MLIKKGLTVQFLYMDRLEVGKHILCLVHLNFLIVEIHHGEYVQGQLIKY